MMDIHTHLSIDRKLCGNPTKVREGVAHVEMTASAVMAADATGLVHGGSIFGMADYAAMLAVNDPNVVLGAAEVTFLQPVAVGETVTAEARVTRVQGKKQAVAVFIQRNGQKVFEGVFTCFVLERHVFHERSNR